MLNLQPLISPAFWFDLTPYAMGPLFARGFFILFAVLIIAASAARMATRHKLTDKYHKIIAARAATIAFNTGVIGFVIYFFTFEEVQFFGARFWFLLLFIVDLVVIGRLIYDANKIVPSLRKKEQSKAEANKYLPRRN